MAIWADVLAAPIARFGAGLSVGRHVAVERYRGDLPRPSALHVLRFGSILDARRVALESISAPCHARFEHAKSGSRTNNVTYDQGSAKRACGSYWKYIAAR